MQDSETPAVPQSWVTVHVRAPQTDWCELKVDQFGNFETTLAEIKLILNKAHAKLNLDAFHVTLVGGGIVERNQVLTHGDKLIVIPISQHSSLVHEAKQKLSTKRGHGKTKLAKELYKPQKMVVTDLGAFDPVTSVYDSCKVKVEMTVEETSQGENKRTTKKLETAKYTLKEMDFKHLECIVMASGIKDHRALVKFANTDWANPLGFSLKMRRPPKDNRDGSRTLRLYCGLSKCQVSQANMTEIELETGLKEEQCYFAISFKFLSQSQTWVLNDEFSTERFWHTHAFYHSYSNSKTPIATANQYFQNYKQTIKKLVLMDTVLASKTIEKSDQYRNSSSFRRPCFSQDDNAIKRKTFNYKQPQMPVQPISDEEADEDEDLKALERQSVVDFGLLFTRLCDLKQTFSEQQGQDMVIQFEEAVASNCVKNLYYQTPQMIEDQAKWSDTGVFINTRMVKTRFKRNLILFCGVDCHGKTVIFAVAFIKDEKLASYAFALQHFIRNQKLFIIERCSALRDALKIEAPQAKVFYNSPCLAKRLRFQLKAIAIRANFSAETQKILTRISKLPLIDNQALYEDELAECMRLFNECPEASDNLMFRDCRTIMKKLQDEQVHWGQFQIQGHFTAGANLSARNEMIRQQLMKDMLNSDLTSIEHAINTLVDVSWLANCQERDYNEIKSEKYYHRKKDSAAKVSLGSVKKQLMLPLSYDEFKVTKSFMIDNDQPLQRFLRGNFSTYVYERSKYNIIQALKYWRVVQSSGPVHQLKFFPPNQQRDMLSQDCPQAIFPKELPILELDRRSPKVKEINGFVFCVCMEYFHTGIPCIHMFTVALRKQGLKVPYAERWFKKYEDKVQPDLIEQIAEHRLLEQAFVVKQLLTPTGDIQIDRKEIKFCGEFQDPGDVDLTKNFVIGDRSRIFVNPSTHEEVSHRQKRAQEEKVEFIETKAKPKDQLRTNFHETQKQLLCKNVKQPKQPKPPKEPKPLKEPKTPRKSPMKKESAKKLIKVKPPKHVEESSQAKAEQVAQSNARLEAMKARILFNQKQKCEETGTQGQLLDFEIKPVKTPTKVEVVVVEEEEPQKKNSKRDKKLEALKEKKKEKHEKSKGKDQKKDKKSPKKEKKTKAIKKPDIKSPVKIKASPLKTKAEIQPDSEEKPEVLTTTILKPKLSILPKPSLCLKPKLVGVKMSSLAKSLMKHR